MLLWMRSCAAVAAVALLGVSPALYQSLHWRSIGPMRGGRTASIAGTASDPNLFYIGVVNGGVWKTTDAGRTWMPIFDKEPTGSIGALAVAPSDPNVIYAASGEGLQRPDLAIGDGIYKSTDAGATWTNTGIHDGQQISALAIDPANPNRVFAAVLGHPYGPNDERGVYRTTDGGATWQRVLFKGADAGAYDVVLDPHDANAVYATIWAARQAPWEIGASFEIPGSGLFKSTDGGTTWTQLTGGIPDRIGRSEVYVAPSDSKIVYFFADKEAKGDDSGAMYRSDDGGAHFTMTSNAPNIGQRGDDLVSIAVDPRDPNTVYETNTSTYRSTDGGRHWTPIKGAPGGDDYHAIWINPQNPDVIGLAADQGATISVNHGATWSSWYNQPTAQMYHVFADDDFPYWVCSGQQESGSACVRSRGDWGSITQRDWHPVGAFEYGYVVEDPLHPGTFYGGKVERFTDSTGQVQEVSPIVLPSKKFRVVRTLPLAFDHFDRHALYFGANVIFKTRDGGRRWTQISPDLTREHPGVPKVLGTFEADDPANGGHRGVVYALAPSYRHEGTIWAGTDDGLVWVTRDAGGHWKNVTPPQLTPWSKIAQIDASRADDDTAFVAVNRFRLDDLKPYVYVTHDGGAHWQLRVDGLPDQPVNAVRQDPVAPSLLYAATENGVFASFDAGAHWQSLQLDLPHTSVRDLVVHGDDVAAGTHGRGFYILTDVEPLRELAAQPAIAAHPVHFFKPALAYRVLRSVNTDTPLPPEEPAGENPPDGAILDYHLGAPAKRVVISIYDRKGDLERRYASDDPPPAPIPDLDKPAWWEKPFRTPPASAGMHRFVWDLREAAPHSTAVDLPISAIPDETPRTPQGIRVPAGTYTVRLDVDGTVQTQTVTLAMDPRVRVTQAAIERQYGLTRALAAMMNRSYDLAKKAQAGGHKDAAERFDAINGAAAQLLDAVDNVDAEPTAQDFAAAEVLRGRLEQATSSLRKEMPSL